MTLRGLHILCYGIPLALVLCASQVGAASFNNSGSATSAEIPTRDAVQLNTVLPATLSTNELSEGRRFIVLYQFTRINNGERIPAFEETGMHLSRISYEGRFGFRNKNVGESYFPTDRILDRAASDIREDGRRTRDQFAVLDIERWSVGNDVDADVAELNKSRYLRVLKELRDRLPDRSYGNYGLPVYRDYRASSSPKSSSRYLAWQSRNDLMQPLADKLDLFLPTLYTFQKDAKDEWVTNARAHVFESRRLARKGQKVIPFIWPQYHDRSRYKGEFLDYSFWKLQLETMFEIADGVFIWSNQSNMPDKSAGWFRATEEFVAGLRNRGVLVETLSIEPGDSRYLKRAQFP